MWLCLVYYIGGSVKLPREVMWELSRCLSRGGSHGGETGFTQQAWSCGGRFISAVQSLSRVGLFVTHGFPVHHQLPEPTQTHVHWVGNAIQPSHPLWSPSPPAFNPSQHQGLFKWVSSSHQVAKELEFQLQHQSHQWTPRIGVDLLAVQGTLKSLLQHHSSKASILQCSAFFTVQLSHPYMTTGKTIALTRQTFVAKVMSLLCFLFLR